MPATGGGLHVGTSGWHYRHWMDRFYPPGTPHGDFLEYYVRQFATVEINATFYRLPAHETLVAWRDAAPDGFLFACKASRYITHVKKLKDPERSTARFVDAIGALGDRLGPVLFQLPPRWQANPDRLAGLLEALPPTLRIAVEFRDRSWFSPAVYDLLARHNAALCLYDLAGYRSPVKLTADFAYVRLHGPGEAYRGSYDGRTLAGWARRFAAWRRQGIEVFCYFDNDEMAYAPADARRLLRMAGGG